MKEPAFEVPLYLRRGAARRDPVRQVYEARWLLENMAKRTQTDLPVASVLDVGCGVKFSQAIATYDIAIGSYVGIDIDPEMIDFLAKTVDDQRFSFASYDSENELYNPAGTKLSEYESLPTLRTDFDLICGFSLFTHLDDDDFGAMLKLMARHGQPGTRLYFSCFINEQTPNGRGVISRYSSAMGADEPPASSEIPPFLDMTTDEPLLHAVFSRQRVKEHVAASGWNLDVIFDPSGGDMDHDMSHPDIVQHQVICTLP